METKDEANKVLGILFNPGEDVYATPDKFASSKNEDGSWKNYRPSVKLESIDKENTRFLTINPLKGDTRLDKNVVSFRSFLFELDDLSLKDQYTLIKDRGTPYSVCTFSGSKSLHFVLTLEEDLPNISVYRFYYEWLLKTIPEADQSTKNPSRGMRFPGVMRPETGKMQKLVEAKSRIPNETFMAYLSRFPDAKPRKKKVSLDETVPANNVHGVAKWVKRGLVEGFDFTNGRNQTWFAIGYEFGKNNFSLEFTYKALESRYNQEDSFPQSEWELAVKKGYLKGLESIGERNG